MKDNALFYSDGSDKSAKESKPDYPKFKKTSFIFLNTKTTFFKRKQLDVWITNTYRQEKNFFSNLNYSFEFVFLKQLVCLD